MSVIAVPGAIRGGQVEKYGVGDRITATVGAGQTATGGLMVEAMTGDRVVRTSQSASVVAWGVAIHDAAAGAQVTVAAEGVWVLLAQGAIGAGVKVICGTVAGSVAAVGSAPSAPTIVGRALAGIADTATGIVKLTV